MQHFPPQFRGSPVRPQNFSEEFTPLRQFGAQIDDTMHPGELFLTFLENSFKAVVEQTNEKGIRVCMAEERVWEPISMDEFIDFTGLCCMIGVFGKTDDVKSYWVEGSAFSIPTFNRMMKYQRFAEILAYLHFGDQGEDLTTLIKFVSVAFEKFHAAFAPPKQLRIDEVFLPLQQTDRCPVLVFRRRPFRQCGIKVVELLDARYGYILAFVLHGEPLGGMEEGQSRAYATVWNLLKRGDAFNQGFYLFTEGRHTVLAAFNNLVEERVYCCGAVLPAYDSGVPTHLLRGDEVTNLATGEYRFVHTTLSSFVTWKDAGDGGTARVLYTIPEVTNQTRAVIREHIEMDEEEPSSKLKVQQLVDRPRILDYMDSYVAMAKEDDDVNTAAVFLLNMTTKMGMEDWLKVLWLYLLKTAAFNAFIIKYHFHCTLDEIHGRYTFQQCLNEIIEFLFENGKQHKSESAAKAAEENKENLPV